MAAFYANAPLPDTNSRQVAQTIRPPSSAILAIDSEDRYKNYDEARVTASRTSPYDFSITKNENLMAGFFTRLGVTEIVFPWSIPNINVKTNQILFSYQLPPADPSSSLILIEPVGFYTPAQIAARIQSHVQALDVSLNTFAMRYGGGGASVFPSNNSALPIFQYASGNPGVLVSFSPMPNNTAAYPFNNRTKQLFDMLGLDSFNTVLRTAAVSNSTFCQAIKYVDIVSSQITNSQSLKDSMSQPSVRDTLCRVYVTDSTGTNQSTISPADPSFCPVGCAPITLYRNFATPKMIQWIPNQNIPGYLTFQVYDDSGELLYKTGVTNNDYGTMDWQMTLLVTEA
jgi:hypothetical protein